MKLKNPLSALFLAGLLGSTVHAEPAAKHDPLRASFQRLLDHQPGSGAPAVPPNQGTDPLRRSVSLVVWEKQGPSYHIAANLGSTAGRR